MFLMLCQKLCKTFALELVQFLDFDDVFSQEKPHFALQQHEKLEKLLGFLQNPADFAEFLRVNLTQFRVGVHKTRTRVELLYKNLRFLDFLNKNVSKGSLFATKHGFFDFRLEFADFQAQFVRELRFVREFVDKTAVFHERVLGDQLFERSPREIHRLFAFT